MKLAAAPGTVSAGVIYVPRPGYYRGVHRIATAVNGWRVVWRCQHHHDWDEEARRCAEHALEARDAGS